MPGAGEQWRNADDAPARARRALGGADKNSPLCLPSAEEAIRDGAGKG